MITLMSFCRAMLFCRFFFIFCRRYAPCRYFSITHVVFSLLRAADAITRLYAAAHTLFSLATLQRPLFLPRVVDALRFAVTFRFSRRYAMMLDDYADAFSYTDDEHRSRIAAAWLRCYAPL